MTDAPETILDAQGTTERLDPKNDPPRHSEEFDATTGSTTPLRDVELERDLLGALVTESTRFWDVGDFLESNHFTEALHGEIYAALRRILDARALCSPTALHLAVQGNEAYRETGGRSYLTKIAARAATRQVDVKELARVLFDLAVRRQGVATLSGGIVSLSNIDPLQSAALVVADIEAGIGRVAEMAAVAVSDVVSAEQAAEEAIRQSEAARRDPGHAILRTGLRDLDAELGGLFASDLVTLGANTSMGKTALVAHLGWHAAKEERHGVLVFSCELSRAQWMTRHIAQLAGVPADRIESGRVTDEEAEAIAKTHDEFKGLPLRIDDSPNLSVAQIRSKLHRTISRIPLRLAVVDHLRFLSPENKRADFTEQQGQITRDLKALAKQLDITVVLISHFNRELWKRDDHRPRLSDLYGASGIEQNSDVVLLLHREEYYLRRQPPGLNATEDEKSKWSKALINCAGKAEISVAKRRRGPDGARVIVTFDPKFTAFGDNQPG